MNELKFMSGWRAIPHKEEALFGQIETNIFDQSRNLNREMKNEHFEQWLLFGADWSVTFRLYYLDNKAIGTSQQRLQRLLKVSTQFLNKLSNWKRKKNTLFLLSSYSF